MRANSISMWPVKLGRIRVRRLAAQRALEDRRDRRVAQARGVRRERGVIGRQRAQLLEELAPLLQRADVAGVIVHLDARHIG